MAAFGRLLLFSQLAHPGCNHAPDLLAVSRHRGLSLCSQDSVFWRNVPGLKRPPDFLFYRDTRLW